MIWNDKKSHEGKDEIVRIGDRMIRFKGDIARVECEILGANAHYETLID